MALQGNPLDLDLPLAYHKVFLYGPPSFGVQFAEFYVYADAEARWAGDDPVQRLSLDVPIPADVDASDENAVKTAVYLDAKTRPLWEHALDV